MCDTLWKQIGGVEFITERPNLFNLICHWKTQFIQLNLSLKDLYLDIHSLSQTSYLYYWYAIEFGNGHI